MASLAIGFPAEATQVKGFVDPPPAEIAQHTQGYTRTRVASPSALLAARRADVAVLLAVKTSLPIAAKPDAVKVSIAGLRFVPEVAACVVDQKIAFTNEDKAPITVLFDQNKLETIPPGESRTIDCTAPGAHKLRVKEWPHIRGSIFIGEVGVAAQPGANGAFALTAPQGKYELMVIGEDGPLVRKDVEIVKTDVDVGRLAVEGKPSTATGGEEPKPAPDPVAPAPGAPKTEGGAQKAVPKPKPAKAPKPAPVEEGEPAGGEQTE